MKLGFFVTNQYLPGESMSEKIEESSEQVRAARDAGFSLIATGQHYLAAPYQMSTSLTLLARLAADAGDMQVAATVILVPLPDCAVKGHFGVHFVLVNVDVAIEDLFDRLDQPWVGPQSPETFVVLVGGKCRPGST